MRSINNKILSTEISGSIFVVQGGSSPWSIKEYQVFPNILRLLHCVPLYVCRLCINYQDLCASLLGISYAASHLHFTLCE